MEKSQVHWDESRAKPRELSQQAKMLGFKIGIPPSHWSVRENGDMVTLYPGDNDALPVYSRDADIFTGTFNQVETFLNGWARAQQYDMMLRITDDKKRKKYEDRERERQRLEKERLEKRRMFAALADRTENEVDRLVK